MSWCGGNVPNFDGWLENTWGAGQAYETTCGAFYGATNLVFGQNPPYYLDDFLSIYPKFFGSPTALSGCGTTIGLQTVTVPSTNGLTYGQFLQSMGNFPAGTVITNIVGNTLTLNNVALVTNTNATLMVYKSPPVPTGVILLYLNLAYASLVQARWQEMWYVAMGLYIVHFLTLYAKSDASEVFETLVTAIHGENPTGIFPGTVYALSGTPPGGVLQSLTKNGLFQVPGVDYTLSGLTITLAAATGLNDVLYATWPVQVETLTATPMNGASIAAAGLFGGIQTSKSVGDVSVGYQALEALADWAAWGLTTYGAQLVTFARVIGMGPMVIWALLVACLLPHLHIVARLLA